MNLWERFVSFFSGRYALQSARYRTAANIFNKFSRKYEGATAGRRGKNWRASSSSANAEIETSLKVLRDRSRQLVRDNPWASRAMQVITSNVVGWGIITQVKVIPGQQNTSGQNTSNTKLQKQLSAMWKNWAESTELDYDRRHDIYGLQRLVIRGVAENGEMIIRKRIVSRKKVMADDGSEVEIPPIEIQVLEPDFLDANNMYTVDPVSGNPIIMGIEFNKTSGKRVAYHLFKEHPGNAFSFSSLKTSFETIRVPAEEIIHCFRTDRAGQVRAVPWLAPVMLRLRDFDEYEDAQLVRQKIAACFSVFIKDIDGGLDAGAMPAPGELGEKVEPGIIEFLPPGKDISFANPPSVDGYGEYSRTQLHAFASGMGITYEALTGDMSQVNFSSGRMGFLEMNRNIEEWRENILICQMMKGVFGWWKEGADLIGQKVDRCSAYYTAPRREMIDPVKETTAMKDSIRSGLMTLSEAVRMQGHDPETHFEEMKKDNEMLDKFGLILDTDPRKDKAQQTAPAKPDEPPPKNNA